MNVKHHLLQEQANDGTAGSAGGAATTTTLPAQARQAPSAMDLENERVAAIDNLVAANNIDQGIRNLWITSGASMRSISDEILAIMKKRTESQPKLTQVGLTAAETRPDWTSATIFSLNC